MFVNFDSDDENEWEFDEETTETKYISQHWSHISNDQSYKSYSDQSLDIMKYGKQIEDITNDCVMKNLHERERIKSLSCSKKHSSEVFSFRLESLNLQQKEFDEFVASTRKNYVISAPDYSHIESTIESFKLECEIFKQFFPGYGLRTCFLDKIKKNQVTVISADCTYFFNVVLPSVLYNVFSDHRIIACESNDVLSQVLQKKINSLFSVQINRIQTCSKRQISVFSEDELLNRFSYNNFFQEFASCIVLNVSVKRSITTDILLANLRNLLITQSNSKLILILSPYENVSLFTQYFSSKTTVSALNTRTLVLPPKVVWKKIQSLPEDDFKNDVVKTAMSIHELCEPGNITVFLPSIDDVKYVFESLQVKIHQYQYTDIKMFCIYDNSFSENLLNSFDNSRKVFLLTHGHEKLVIPSVCYVIDCGIQKEQFFDSESETDILKPTFISQVRSKLRRNLAGVYDKGTCFRLYNKVNYLRNMPSKEKSEIFCINPFHGMIKIFQYHSDIAYKAEFVESLPEHTLSDTLMLLKDYDVVTKDLQLTSLGKNIVKLPFPPKYSRLILCGLQKGFAYETITLVAFFSVGTEIFHQSDDINIQKLIYASQLEFSHLNSDTLSYLKIFKMWKEGGFKMQWCRKHYIDYVALKNIHSKTAEICDAILKNLGKRVKEQFCEIDKFPDLIQLLFQCFQTNLCVFTGHPRSGYRVLSSKSFAFVSERSLPTKIVPQFVIYEKLLNQNVIANLTCIPYEFILECLEKNTINFTYADLFEETLVKKVIEPVGQKLISQVLLKNDYKKVREIENNIKEETCAEIIFVEPDLEKSCIVMYAFPCHIDKCYIALDKIVKNYAEEMSNEEESKIIELRKGQNSVFVEIKWTKGALTLSSECDLLHLNFADAVVVNTTDSVSPFIHYSLKLIWPRRICTGEGFLNFCKEDFVKARKLPEYISVSETEIFVEISHMKENQLHLLEISPEVTEKDLRNYFSKLLPECKVEIDFCYVPPFETSDDELLTVKMQIEENCKAYTNLQNFDVEVTSPLPSDKYMIAFIHVFEQRSLDQEVENISTFKINGMKVLCEPLYFCNILCNFEIYTALKCRIQEEIKIFENEFLESHRKDFPINISVNVIINDNIATMKLSSSDLEVIGKLKMMIKKLLDGIKLDKNNVMFIHKLFCHGGHIFLKNLEKTENIFIIENFETKTLRLYGSQKNCNNARQCINDFLEAVENEVFKTIILSSDKHNRMILKAVITEYGANLEKFIELCDLRSASLDIKSCCLLLYGKEESIKEAEACIKKLSSDVVSYDTSSFSSEELCPVCQVPAENLTYRLELCGHLYCPECIQGLIAQNNFPIQCCAANCSKDILLGDIKYVLTDDENLINELASESLKDYLRRNYERICYCPAADCSMFCFKDELPENKWNCPLCRNDICVSCNVVYHEGMECDMYQGTQADEDYQFRVYQQDKDCKQCPTCGNGIEKTEGCNHMTCNICKGHFCWICVTSFNSGNEVYKHIGTAHPGRLFDWN